jgi:TctA family transporter
MGNYLLILWILSSISVAYIQLHYAKASYPRSLQWRLRLFVSAFASGALGVLAFLQEASVRDLLILTILVGLFSGTLFTFLFPSHLRALYKQQKTDE